MEMIEMIKYLGTEEQLIELGFKKQNYNNNPFYEKVFLENGLNEHQTIAINHQNKDFIGVCQEVGRSLDDYTETISMPVIELIVQMVESGLLKLEENNEK